jgi:hypothetical protein
MTFPNLTYFDNLFYNCSEQEFYGMLRNASGAKLATIDLTSGTPTAISSQYVTTGTSSNYTVDEYNGRYYMLFNSNLYSIDLSTGDVINILPINLPATNYFECFSFNCSDNRLYGIQRDPLGVRFARMNPDNGNVTILNNSYLSPCYIMGGGWVLDEVNGLYYLNNGDELYTLDIYTGSLVYDVSLVFDEPGNHYLYYINKLQNCNCAGLLSGLTDEDKTELNIFPNPAHEQITLNVPEAYLNSTLLLSDLSGRLIMKQDIRSDQTQFSVSELPNGAYFVELKGAKGSVRKMVVKN